MCISVRIWRLFEPPVHGFVVELDILISNVGTVFEAPSRQNVYNISGESNRVLLEYIGNSGRLSTDAGRFGAAGTM